MAIGKVYSGKSTVYGVALASAFGTGMADATAAKQLSCKAFIINPDTKHRVPDRQTPGQNWKDVADVSNDRKGSLITVPITMVALKAELALWFYLVMQKVTEGATTPFQKTFALESPGPDFSNNEGCFITLWGKSQVASASEKVDALIGQKLELSLSPTENDGNLFCNLSLAGKGWSRGANPSGTWTRVAQTPYRFHDLARFTVDANNLVLNSVKLTIENTLVQIGSDGQGNFQSLALAQRVASAEITALWDTYTRAILSNYDSGSETVLNFGWGTTGQDGYLDFTLHGRLSDAKPVEDDIRKVTFTIDGASDLASSEVMLAAAIADAVDWAW